MDTNQDRMWHISEGVAAVTAVIVAVGKKIRGTHSPFREFRDVLHGIEETQQQIRREVQEQFAENRARWKEQADFNLQISGGVERLKQGLVDLSNVMGDHDARARENNLSITQRIDRITERRR